MANFFEKITADQGTVEDLVRKIPGFKGYFEKQDRRAADELLRDQLVRIFEEQMAEFVRLQREVIDTGGIMYMERAQGVHTKLQTFIDRIRTASEGYAGLFDAIKVDEVALSNLYAFDNALLIYQEQFAQGLSRLAEALGTDQVGDILRQLDSVVVEANNTFKRRVEAIQGMDTAV